MLQCVDSLIPISAATLFEGAAMGCDVFLKSNGNSKQAVLFCRGGTIAEPSELRPLMHGGVTKLYINRHDRDHYQHYLRENWRELLADSSKSARDQIAVISEVARDVLHERFQAGETEGIVAATLQMGRETCELLGSQPLLASELCSVLHHDYATFTHSTNVSMYAVLLARRLGYAGDELSRIAAGGLLHDIGKLKIDEKILTKPGRLDDYEFREIQKHPTIGLRELTEQQDVCFGQLMMTYQHHERLDGTGYPVGIGSDEIHPWAKICAIVDVFEAITSHRPYRQPLSTSTALAVLEKGNGTEFDSEMLQCWRQLMS